MGFYEGRILPVLLDLACSQKPIAAQRQKVVPHAEGRVLEIGMGSGLNLPFYDASRVERVWGLEPSEGMRRRAARRVSESPVPVEWLDLPGEQIPLEDGSVDCVLLTYTLCTIPDYTTALAGMRRVLRPGGKLLFCEHGAAPDPRIRAWQDRINPLWGRLLGGCHVNRDVPALLRGGGFEIEQLEQMYLPNTPKVAGYQYWGLAVPA